MGENLKSIETTRFSMVKERHSKKLENAIKVGSIDKRVIPLCRFINSTKNYFTSSSCAGRIVLLGVPYGEDKEGSYFHRKWHSKVKFADLWKAIKEKPSLETATFTPERKKKFVGKIGGKNDELWFKLDGFIFHIGCNNLENAKTLLKALQKAGAKRYGIIVAKEGKFIVEVIGTQNIAMPIKKGNKIIVGKKYLQKVLEIANKKLMKNYSQLKKLENVFKKELE